MILPYAYTRLRILWEAPRGFIYIKSLIEADEAVKVSLPDTVVLKIPKKRYKYTNAFDLNAHWTVIFEELTSLPNIYYRLRASWIDPCGHDFQHWIPDTNLNWL